MPALGNDGRDTAIEVDIKLDENVLTSSCNATVNLESKGRCSKSQIALIASNLDVSQMNASLSIKAIVC